MADEKSLIDPDKTPLSKSDIMAELTRMGLANGDLVLLHVAISKLGWVTGGVQAVLEAVLEVLGESGTLVMPGFSSQLSDPAYWSSPPVPKAWISQVQENMPIFDPDLTPTRGVGKVAEALRALPATRRSHHPVDSFLGHGPLAKPLLADHPLAHSLGRDAPLGRLYDANAKVLLLGAGFDTCTAFHLAEDRLKEVAGTSEKLPIRRAGNVTLWQDTQQPRMFETHFAVLGHDFQASGAQIATGFEQKAHLFAMRPAVDFARDWLQTAYDAGQLSP